MASRGKGLPLPRVSRADNRAFPPLVRGGEIEYVAGPVDEISGQYHEHVPARLPLREAAGALQCRSHQLRTVIPAHQAEVIALEEHHSVVSTDAVTGITCAGSRTDFLCWIQCT